MTYLKVAKRVDHKVFITRKRKTIFFFFGNCMMTNVNYNYCGDNSGIYTNIQSLCCTPETNIICQLIPQLKRSMNITSAAP